MNTIKLKRIELPFDRIKTFCSHWKISEFSLFGSILRDDFHPDSDIDVLVSFSPDATWSLFDLVTMQQELEQILGREVDLIERQSIEQSHNWIRRKEILSTAKTIYVAR